MMEISHNRFLFLGVAVLLIVGSAYLFSHQDKNVSSSKQILASVSDELFVNPQTESQVEPPDLTFIQKNSLVGISCSQIISSKTLGVLMGGEIFDEHREITEYVVEKGDTLTSIAEKFGVSLETILWANNLTSKSVIQPGQKLIILPVSGVLHHVKKGDTLSKIAILYEANIEDIIAFNDLSEEGDIYVGDILIIPGGKKPAKKSYLVRNTKTIPVASSYFIPPVSSPYRITQGLHWYNAVDFANSGGSCGKPVFAAAGGKVLKVKYGHNKGAGNYVRILHPNGLITHYGHLQKILVVLGQEVSQGEIIGLIGHSGKTIPAGPAGCHLHFGLYSSEGKPPLNPFAR